MYTVTIATEITNGEVVSRYFETKRAAVKWFGWLCSQSMTQRSSLYHGQPGEELLDRIVRVSGQPGAGIRARSSALGGAVSMADKMDQRQYLNMAIEYLGARQNPADAGEYIYTDDATQAEWVSDEDDLIDLGRDLSDGREDAYSFWCAEHTARQV